MKTKLFTKTLSLLLALAMLFCVLPVSAFAQAPAETAEAAETQSEKRLELVTVPLYIRYSTNVFSSEIAFADENRDIPYVSLTTAMVYLQNVAGANADPGWTYTLEQEGSRYKITRENGSFILMDGETQDVAISDIQGLRAYSYSATLGDIVAESGVFRNEDGSVFTLEDGTPAVHYLTRSAEQYNVTHTGYDLMCNIKKEYGIELIIQDGELYLPLATVNDWFMSGVYMLFNGEALFLTYPTLDDTEKNENGQTFSDLYYSVGTRPRSQSLADFNYNELCMFLDLNYGLAAEHNMADGFQKFCEITGLKDALCSTDSLTFEKALCDLLMGYMCDMHSAFVGNSSYTGNVGRPVTVRDGNYISAVRHFNIQDRFYLARQEAGLSVKDEDGKDQLLENYSEIGDTAFITFDEFVDAKSDYYNVTDEELAKLYTQDTMGLVIYANKQINRENSPIRKVVIDLSLNGGGVSDVCVYLAAWILGKAQVSTMNPLTKACYTTLYTADVNLDGRAGGEGDFLDLTKLDVYCLISDNSFSCGNLLPCMLKEDGRVTLVGQTTGGGACVVQFAVTADGTAYRCSGFYKLCTIKNGSYYSIDQGVDPDIPLRKLSSFYDREWLVSYLDTIH